jgi:predicted SAM-dependent methyltransferase
MSVKLQFGCGGNRLEGWQNYDSEIDIAKPPLPFRDAYADFIFAEHVLEHVPLQEAIRFLRDCHRILKPGGTIRLAVPSIVRIRQFSDRRGDSHEQN